MASAPATTIESTFTSSAATALPVTVAFGDGIGPEIMDATLRVLDTAGAHIRPETIEIGERVYRRGVSAGIEEASWESLLRTQVFLKAPITTPLGGGYKSLNVTVRKALGLFANVRPCSAYAPFVKTRHPDMDVVIIRENEEDLYAGIEHRQTDEVVQCLKLISRPGCEKIARYAFAYARAMGRRKVSCFSKDNIMKLTDGLFHSVFSSVAKEYPDIEAEHMIVDIGAARLVDTPDRFDVVLLPNLYGDILSDVAAQMTGSVGLAGSANIGDSGAMFEAVHGSAPDLDRDQANPSGLLNAAVMMLQHIGRGEAAARVRNAWLRTIEEGVHTRDIANAQSRHVVGTRAFAEAVITNLGERPHSLRGVEPSAKPVPRAAFVYQRPAPAQKEFKGIDVFIDNGALTADDLAARLRRCETSKLTLQMITNRGIKVWPHGLAQTFCTDHWRCRFTGDGISAQDPLALLFAITNAGLDVIKTENLYTFDGTPGYSLGQGQ